jgi:hypothetical protein
MRVSMMTVGLAVSCCMGVLSTSASAQENPYGGGTRLPQRPETIDRGVHETRIALQQFARCTVKNRAEAVKKYLLDDVGQQEIAKLREKALDASCLQGEIGPDDVELRLSGLSLQGALAEQMMAKQGLLSQPIDISTVAPLDHSPLDAATLHDFDAASRQMIEAEDYLFRFGECVVRSNVNDSLALLKSQPESAEETAAFTRLMPAFGGCVERNRTITGDKIGLRAAIAYNYYRLAEAPRAPNSTIAAKK